MEDRIRYPEVDTFLRATIKRENGFIREMELYAEKNHIPIVPPETAAFLKILINVHKPEKILEAGTAIGYSSIVMLGEMAETGIIDTIEIDEDVAQIARKNIAYAGFTGRIRILSGDALMVMKCIEKMYDMIFLDASKGQYNEYLDESLRLLRPGGLLVSDNVLYKGLVTQEEPVMHKHRTITVKLREYLSRICNDDRLLTSIVPIGDGITVSVKR